MTEQFGLDADCMMFEAGRRAAEDISQVIQDKDALQAGRYAEDTYGWNKIGAGVGRTAFGLPLGEDEIAFEVLPEPVARSYDDGYIEDAQSCVVKVGPPHSGQMSVEIDQYRKIAGKEFANGPWHNLEDYVAPVIDYDQEQSRWLTMPKGDTGGNTSAAASQLEHEISSLGFEANDLHNDNVAFFNGEPRVIDLGFEFVWAGTTEQETWDEWRDFLEEIGCRDVLRSRVRRKYFKYEFRPPVRLPGLPYEVEDSFIEYDRGGSLHKYELWFTQIPKDAASVTELEHRMDEVVDFREVIDPAPAVVELDDTFVPKIRIGRRYDIGNGPDTYDVMEMLASLYDRYDAKITPLVDDYDYSQLTDNPPEPPETSSGTPVIDEIMEEFREMSDALGDD